MTVLTGWASHGQGHETSYTKLVADELRVPVEHVTVVHGDTARVRSGVGTFGSRSIARGGLDPPLTPSKLWAGNPGRSSTRRAASSS